MNGCCWCREAAAGVTAGWEAGARDYEAISPTLSLPGASTPIDQDTSHQHLSTTNFYLTRSALGAFSGDCFLCASGLLLEYEAARVTQLVLISLTRTAWLPEVVFQGAL